MRDHPDFGTTKIWETTGCKTRIQGRGAAQNRDRHADGELRVVVSCDNHNPHIQAAFYLTDQLIKWTRRAYNALKTHGIRIRHVYPSTIWKLRRVRASLIEVLCKFQIKKKPVCMPVWLQVSNQEEASLHAGLTASFKSRSSRLYAGLTASFQSTSSRFVRRFNCKFQIKMKQVCIPVRLRVSNQFGAFLHAK